MDENPEPEAVADGIDLDIPEPDYSDSDEDRDLSAVGNEGVDEAATSSKKIDDLGVQTSKEQQAVMRELLRNQKLGVSVFSKKSELDKELEKRKLRQQRREEEEIQRQKRSSFELRMEEQAKKLLEAEQQQQQQQQAVSDCADDQPEFLKVHSKINKVKSAS